MLVHFVFPLNLQQTTKRICNFEWLAFGPQPGFFQNLELFAKSRRGLPYFLGGYCIRQAIGFLIWDVGKGV